MRSVTVVISAHGHKNIEATHKTTFEITKKASLTRRGDCIIAVEASRATSDLPNEFKEAASKEGAQITITIDVGDLKEEVKAKGSPQLTFTHPTDLVIRKSSYICSRTLAIGADKAGSDLSRKLVERIKDPKQEITIKLTVEDY